MEANHFTITRTNDTKLAGEMFIQQLDRQIEEFQNQIGLLQDLRHHAARTFEVDRPKPGESFVKTLTDGATRRVFEGDRQDQFEREVGKVVLDNAKPAAAVSPLINAKPAAAPAPGSTGNATG